MESAYYLVMDEEECWELVWPPSLVDDKELIGNLLELIQDQCKFDQHEAAWKYVCNPTSGLNGDMSLLDELREKSGKVCEPFMNEIISNVFGQIGTQQFGRLVEEIFNYSIPNNDHDENDEQTLEIESMKLYQGVTWELVAIFSTILLCGPTTEASCYCPTERHVALGIKKI